MSSRPEREVEFDRLNLLGKVVFVTGTTVRVIGSVIDSVVETVSGVVQEAEKAFKEGMDPNIDEATIVDEGKNQSS